MRLVDPGPGELSGRLSILALKIAHGTQADKDVTHFVTERNALLVQLRQAAPKAGIEQFFDLAAVNGMLWYAEDELREHRKSFGFGMGNVIPDEAVVIIKIAFRIQALNDRRADLVRQLNTLSAQDLGPEKLV